MPLEQYPHIEATLPIVAEVLRAYWISLAIPSSNTGDYIRGLQSEGSVVYPYRGNNLSIAVVNVSNHAAVVEWGHAGFHLPDHVKNWKHFNKKGRGYFVIPFRHFVPGSAASSTMARRQVMPEEIYSAAKNLGRGERLRGLGDLYKQSKSYVYYRAKEPNFPAGLLRQALRTEGQPGYTWRASKYEGMQRSAQRGLHFTSGVYSTFRTVSQDSAGYWIPAMPGQFYAQKVIDAKKTEIAGILAKAAAKDTSDKISVLFATRGFQVAV